MAGPIISFSVRPISSCETEDEAAHMNVTVVTALYFQSNRVWKGPELAA